MTESLPCVVVPYARFHEYQERRRRIIELMERTLAPVVDTDGVSQPAAAAAQTLNGEER